MNPFLPVYTVLSFQLCYTVSCYIYLIYTRVLSFS